MRSKTARPSRNRPSSASVRPCSGSPGGLRPAWSTNSPPRPRRSLRSGSRRIGSLRADRARVLHGGHAAAQRGVHRLRHPRRGLEAIPRDNLKTVIDESYTAVGGLGPELSRLIQGASTLAIDARKNLDPLTTLIDQAQPVLDSQTNTSDAIQAWASQLATVTAELQTHDEAVAGVIDKGGPAAAEVRQLVERLAPTLPILMANLVKYNHPKWRLEQK